MLTDLAAGLCLDDARPDKHFILALPVVRSIFSDHELAEFKQRVTIEVLNSYALGLVKEAYSNIR